jgi:hypothetical protein
MPRANYDELPLYCLMCTALVPDERRRFKAITCSEACATLRKNMIRSRADKGACRYCRKPSTPEQRAAFLRFSKLEKKQPELLYPDEYKQYLEIDDVPMPAKFLDWMRSRREAEEAAGNE